MKEDSPVLCWRCGHAYTEDTRNMPRATECAACHADLHVCRMCEFYDTGVARSCRETIAEEVKDKERANFCGYFKVGRPRVPASTDTGATRSRLESLFGIGGGQSAAGSSADAAKQALDALFNLGEAGKRDGER